MRRECGYCQTNYRFTKKDIKEYLTQKEQWEFPEKCIIKVPIKDLYITYEVKIRSVICPSCQEEEILSSTNLKEISRRVEE